MKKTKYTADYFIKKFSKIPSNQWCKGSYTNHLGQHCVLGHLKKRYPTSLGVRTVSTGESGALTYLMRAYAGLTPVLVNDGYVEAKRLFPNKTTKGRVLAVLEVIKLMQAAGLDPVKEEASDAK